MIDVVFSQGFTLSYSDLEYGKMYLREGSDCIPENGNMVDLLNASKLWIRTDNGITNLAGYSLVASEASYNTYKFKQVQTQIKVLC